MLRAIHFSPLPCSDLGQGVAISTTAFTLPRFFVHWTGINTEVSRYILGIGNTKQLTTNTIYRIGSLLYILARINILGGAPVVSMFGANLIKCQLSLPRAKSESV
jgi:hypothetical protein